MITFQQTYETAQEASGDTSATTLVLIKRWTNQGVRLLQSALGREWTRKSQTASIVASQQYYQLPEDCIRPSEVIVTVNSIPYLVEEVTSEHRWRQLNEHNTSNTASIPLYYFVRGKDELGLWPKPSSNISSGLEVVYEPLDKDMTADDYTTGTVTVTNGSATVTGSGTTFTQQMIGRYFQVTSGDDGFWYKIAGYTSSTVVTLENLYEGIGGAGKGYKIGEMPNLPGDLHDSLVDYVMFRLSLRRRDKSAARDYKALWDGAIDDAQIRFGKKTSSGVIAPVRGPLRRDWKWANRDNTVS